MDNVNDDLVPSTLQVSAADRLQRFREDDQALAELAVKVHERAMVAILTAPSRGQRMLR
jgi:hypothetical protein